MVVSRRAHKTILERARNIIIEGPIGVGKSSLARKLVATYEAQLLLEKPEDNPFLERFYEAPLHYALPTQLFFLFQRVRQIEEFERNKQISLTSVADFMIDKDPLFARLNLDDDEFELYQQAFDSLTVNVTLPDLVIYLQAPTEVLLERVGKRGISYEQGVDPDYLTRLSDAYTDYFYHYRASPLLIINAAEINFVDNPDHYTALVRQIDRIKAGRHFFNPMV